MKYSLVCLSNPVMGNAKYDGRTKLRTCSETDKSKVFEIFYGNLEKAPMITLCPINMECRLYDIYDTPTYDLIIGEIVETYADEAILKDGKVDLAVAKPLLFDMSSIQYWSIGKALANCWNVGKKMKQR